MRLDQMVLNGTPNPLAPHYYIHDFVPGRYLVVQPRKGHSTIFRVKDGYSTPTALAMARKRGFKPLYVVRAEYR